MKTGYYEVEGNTVYYEGGDTAFDIDSQTDIPVEYLEAMGVYLGAEI